MCGYLIKEGILDKDLSSCRTAVFTDDPMHESEPVPFFRYQPARAPKLAVPSDDL
ncbi:hypothetical protein DSO57_1004685 [Entomophthora muscae]|uniref:Uncharacterized protein n=1 Tax=Entomophthora muscae TaxID=34485 RepID=A0ACC2U6R9_9FUNG|nr:hypothetical protein DSO57_1004685 [Entomophthora muscae]